MSISIRHQMQLDGYYTPPRHNIYPLTMENVSKVTLADPSNMPLARFCKEMESSTHLTSTTSSPRAGATDSVMESPRILPFPYHNDSYFLPTAEHDYPGYSTTDSSSLSSSRVGSRQFMSSMTSVNNRVNTAGRVSSPIRHCETTFNDCKNDYVYQKSFILRLKERISKSCKKFWNRDTVTPHLKKTAQFDSGSRKNTSCTPVWYSQFRCNPSPSSQTNPVLLS